MTATVKDQNGNTMADVAVTWSSGARAIATVDAAGLVTAAGNGRATITAKAETASGDAAVTVEQVPAAVALVPDSLGFSALGDSDEFMATVTDANGHTIEGAAVTWSSGDPAVARVDQDGLVGSTGNGRTAITARAGAATGSAPVTVEQIPADVMLDPDSLAFAALGDTATLAATVLDANGHAIEGATVVWSNGDPGVATVNANGLVTAAGNGRATITATSGKAAGTVAVTVDQVPSAIVLAPDSLAFAALGDTATVAATVLDANGHAVESAAVQWASEDPTVATVNANGLVTAAGNGRATIHATSGKAAITAAVTVGQVVVEIALEPASLSFTVVGDTARFVATAIDANGYIINGAVFTWSSSDHKIATVDATGLVTTAANGLAAITATSGDVSATAEVTVQQAPATVVVAPDSLAFTALGDTATLAATVLDANGHAIEGAAVTWSSDDATIATVNASGSVTATSNGYATVTAMSGGAAGTAAVTVEQEADSVAVSPAAATIATGATLRLTARAFDANGHGVAGARFTWRSSDASIASVDGTGLVRGTGEGTAAVTAQSGNARGSAEVTVGNPDRAVLVAFYHSTGGDRWANNSNWLQDTPLGQWHGVSTDQRGYVRTLELPGNGLAGSIPPELGNLTNLERLSLSGNDLTGAIPSELGHLDSLRYLYLDHNDLSGSIPSELGDLDSLRNLYLNRNDLVGNIPPAFSGLEDLQHLQLNHNSSMAGALSPTLTAMAGLDLLAAGGTELCAQTSNPSVRSWLDKIPAKRIDSCTPSDAYLVQAVQSRHEHERVQMVAGEAALLRVFLVAAKKTNVHIPDVVAKFFLSGFQVREVSIPGKPTAIPTVVDEGDLSKSVNAVVPADIVKPGLEVVIEVDPVDASLGVPRRIPATGRLKIPVSAVPSLELTLIPFLYDQDPDSSIISTIDGMARDPEGHKLLQHTRDLLPVDTIDVTAHLPVTIDSRRGFAVLYATLAIRASEGGSGHWKGMMPWFSDVGGVAYRPGWVSASNANSDVIAHELGHNMNLRHAPCGRGVFPAGTDPNFPDERGRIGSWGYDFRTKQVVPPTRPDLMSYCGPSDGISGFHFGRARHHRLGLPQPWPDKPAARSLLLWGGRLFTCRGGWGASEAES